MSKRAVLYARVSSEEQAKGDAVSIDSQIADMGRLCERNGWQIHSTFVDCENYRGTQQPKKGKVVSPSGERADRPHFLAMLDIVKSGAADVVLCWRDDRLMRHPRVAVALEDALDVGDVARPGRAKITIHDATGAIIDRFTLSIKAVIWREENKRRVERIKMGKVGTLEKGRWPGSYCRFGYTARIEPGQRGCTIEHSSAAAVQTVKDIFNWYDQGVSTQDIHKKLIERGDQQRGHQTCRYGWSPAIILHILGSEDYTGIATWKFEDKTFAIKIPPIVSHEQWERVQKRLVSNRRLSTRNSSRVYVLHYLTECGECGGGIYPQVRNHYYGRLANGKLKRYVADPPVVYYRCTSASKYHTGVEHPGPWSWRGDNLEWAVWRYLVDNGIKRPDLIIEQVTARQQELIEQGESVDSDINRVRAKMAEIDQERAFYQRQAARGTITEKEFDIRMAETLEAWHSWKAEAERLQELRDNAAKVRGGIDYTIELLKTFARTLADVDVPPVEFDKLPQAQQEAILKARQKIVRALCDKITVYSTGRIVIDGLLDGSALSHFELAGLHNGLHKMLYSFDFNLADSFFASAGQPATIEV